MINELFLRAQQQRHLIENELVSLNGQNYSLINCMESQNENYQTLFNQKSFLLENKKEELLKELNQLKVLLKAIQDQQNQMNSAQIAKLNSFLQNGKELEISIINQCRQKLEKLKDERNKISILGEHKQNISQDNIGLLIDQQNSLNQSHKLVEESMKIGEEVLVSFGQQNDALKRIQSKVNNIIGDMGMSQGIIKLLGSRDIQDKRIFIFLSFLLLLFIFTLYYVFK